MRDRKTSRSLLALWPLLIMVNRSGLAARSGASGTMPGTATDTSGAVLSGALVARRKSTSRRNRGGRSRREGNVEAADSGQVVLAPHLSLAAAPAVLFASSSKTGWAS